MAPFCTTTFFTSPSILHPSLKSNSLPPFEVSISSPTVSVFRLKARRILAVAEQEKQVVVSFSQGESLSEGGYSSSSDETTKNTRVQPWQLYVCNLPRSYDVAQLLELFNRFGTVNSVEVSKDPETGLSKGCGFVTMNSYLEAREAISSLDGSDVSGRQILVKLTRELKSQKFNSNPKSNSTKSNYVYESPFKIYVGNLSWSVQPEDLKEHFSKYGSVTSSRLIHDRKDGRHRVYGFVSFSNDDQRLASLVSSQTLFHGREMTVRSVTEERRINEV